GTQRDLAVSLMLGTAQGGIEISAHADRRPAPSGITFRLTEANLDALAALQQDQIATLKLDVIKPDLMTPPGTLTPPQLNLQPARRPVGPGKPFSQAAVSGSPNGNSDGVREKWGILAGLVNSFVPANPAPPPANLTSPWTAAVWGSRLSLMPTDLLVDNFLSASFALTTNPALPAGALTHNLHYYSLGASGHSIGLPTSAGAPAPPRRAP